MKADVSGVEKRHKTSMQTQKEKLEDGSTVHRKIRTEEDTELGHKASMETRVVSEEEKKQMANVKAPRFTLKLQPVRVNEKERAVFTCRYLVFIIGFMRYINSFHACSSNINNLLYPQEKKYLNISAGTAINST